MYHVDFGRFNKQKQQITVFCSFYLQIIIIIIIVIIIILLPKNYKK